MDRGNELLIIDKMKTGSKNGNMSTSDLRKMRRCFIFLGIFIVAISIAAVILL